MTLKKHGNKDLSWIQLNTNQNGILKRSHSVKNYFQSPMSSTEIHFLLFAGHLLAQRSQSYKMTYNSLCPNTKLKGASN